jgi:membrane associated rhomboid family serine protease
VISLIALNNEGILSGLMMNPYSIRNKNQYYRFLTSGFIHINHIHLMVNMFSLYFFGTAVEYVFASVFGVYGQLYFIALYLMAIVVSDLPTYFKQKENPAYNSLGASGGVAAVIFAFIIFQPLQDICFFIAFCMRGFIAGALYIGYSYYQGKKSKDSINHDAHLYGALFGLVFCIIAFPPSIRYFIEQIRSWIDSM